METLDSSTQRDMPINTCVLSDERRQAVFEDMVVRVTCAQPSLCYLIPAVCAFRAYEVCLFSDIVYLTL